MKAFITFVLGSFFALSAIAQTSGTVNILFRGINNGTKNYQVMVDDVSYYSNTNSGNVANYRISLNNLPLGTHSLKVYSLKSNNPVNNGNNQNTFVYSKDFVLRSGYDMNITILANGRVQFSEQSSPLSNGSVVNTQMADYEFNQLMQSVRGKWSQSLKVTALRNAFLSTENYFSTSQIRQLLSLVTAESNRLDLAKASYRSATDPLNFTLLSDMFSSTANRNDFNNYVSLNSGSVISSSVKSQMSNTEFNRLLQNVQAQWSQSLKADAVRNALINTNNYFNTSQLRQLLPLISSESDRLDLAKLSYRAVTDPGNFIYLSDMFSTTAYRNEFNNYVSLNTGQVTTNSTVRTQITDYQFNQLLQSVKDKWSQSLKSEAERDAFLNTSNYFSTAQIRQLLSLITSESDRLDLAKLSYRSVMDPAYFPQLADLFSTTAYRNDFNNYVTLQGGQILSTTTAVRTPMTDSDFSVLVFSIRSNLLQVLKVSAERDVFNNTNYAFSTAQVKQLISLINSENSRLELAKLSYARVTDPANFTQIYDLFKTQTNKDDLANFIKTNY